MPISNNIDKLKLAQSINYNWHFPSVGTPDPNVVEFAIALKDLARKHKLKVQADRYGRLEVYDPEMIRPDNGWETTPLAITMFL